jgi:hypothetical protein
MGSHQQRTAVFIRHLSSSTACSDRYPFGHPVFGSMSRNAQHCRSRRSVPYYPTIKCHHHSTVERLKNGSRVTVMQRRQEPRTLVGMVDCSTTDELHALVSCCPGTPWSLLHRADVRQHGHPHEPALPSRWFLAAISSASPT